MESSIDRRIFERMHDDFTGWDTLKDNEKILGEFAGLDFSGSGIRINARRRILEGRALDVSLVSVKVSEPIKESAQVIWQRELSPGWWQAGLRFYHPGLAHLWPLVHPEQYQED
ncbi:MAG TPA: hypothetical protein DEQ77_08700 [Candidatus Omnitrophica bacterium]|nr:hypothetical protein [Candidatus Omnitrophota bacterium]